MATHHANTPIIKTIPTLTLDKELKEAISKIVPDTSFQQPETTSLTIQDCKKYQKVTFECLIRVIAKENYKLWTR